MIHRSIWVAAPLCVAAIVACSDEGEGDTTSSSSTTTSSNSTTTSSGGGEGGGGEGGGGGAGGGEACLPAADFAADFALVGADLCVTERIDAPGLFLEPYGATPSWGRHGGLLTIVPDAGGVTLARWSLVDGALVGDTTSIAVPSLPSDAFVGEHAVDLPGTTSTAFLWTGSDFFNDGGVVVLGASAVVDEELVTGGGGLAVSAAATGRLFHSGLSAVGGPTNATVGLYAADVAGSTLASGALVEAWGLASGPTAVDEAGNVLAIQTDYVRGTQDVRVFEAADIVAGSATATGTTLAVLGGYGDAVAALAPVGDLPGLLVLQRNDGALGAHQDVELLRYTPGEAVADPATSAEALLELVTDDTNVTLTADDAGRLWVGLPRAGGAVFYVLERAD